MKKIGNSGFRRTVTAGGGLCAFASFAQGLVDHILMRHFDTLARKGEFQFFLDIFSEFEETAYEAEWPAFVEYLQDHLESTDQLQWSLAKVLRILVVALRAHGMAPLTEEETLALQVAFSEYLCKELKLKNWEKDFRGDDIYLRHEFITRKFSNLLETYFPDIDLLTLRAAYSREGNHFSDEEGAAIENFNYRLALAKDDLVQWYEDAGYQLFSEAMAKNGAYAGDLELKILAQYWHCTFKVQRSVAGQDIIYAVHFDYGVIEVNDEVEALVLKNLRIVDRTPVRGGQFRLNENTAEAVQLRLADIPHAEAIITQWRAWMPINGALNRELRAPIVIADDWAPTVCSELIARDIVECTAGQYFFTHITEEDLRTRLAPLKSAQDRARLFTLWENNYKPAPEILCANDNAIHWEYMQHYDYPWKQLQTSFIEPSVETKKGVRILYTAAQKSREDRVFGTTLEQKRMSAARAMMKLPKLVIFPPQKNDVFSRDIQGDAMEVLVNFQQESDYHSEQERQFYARVQSTLTQITLTRVISPDGALLFLDPKRAFSRLFPKNFLQESGMLSELEFFQQRYHLKLLSIAHAHLIDHIKSALVDIDYLITILNNYEMNDVANAFSCYQFVFSEILRCYTEVGALPAVGHDGLIQEAENVGQNHLDREHNWIFCDNEYQEHLTQVRDCLDQMDIVLHESTVGRMAHVLTREMVSLDIDTEHTVFNMVATLGAQEELDHDELEMLLSIDLILDDLSDYPILEHSLRVFFARVKEELQLSEQNGFTASNHSSLSL